MVKIWQSFVQLLSNVKLIFLETLINHFYCCCNKNALWVRCLVTLTDLAHSLFLMGWVKVNMNFHISPKLVEAVTNVGIYPYFSFFRPDLSPWGYRNRFFGVAFCHLAARRWNLKVANERHLYQDSFRAVFMELGQLYSVLWIFLAVN